MEREEFSKKKQCADDLCKQDEELKYQDRIYKFSNIWNKTEGLKYRLTESKGRAENTGLKDIREFSYSQYELIYLSLQNELFDEDKASICDDPSETKFDCNKEQNLQIFKEIDFEEDTKIVGGQIKDTEIDVLTKIVQRSSFEKEEYNDTPSDIIYCPTLMERNQQNEKYEKLISII